MAKYVRKAKTDSSVILLLFLALLVTTYHTQLIHTLCVGIGIIAFLFLMRVFKRVFIYRRNIVLSDIDLMDGIDFERYIAGLLKKKGFSNVKLTEKYDLGVDIVAQKDGQTWGIQVKRYTGLVKASAVRQVVTALNAYNCDRSMVITNSRYSNVAKRLALTNNCVLIDRSKLLKLMS